MDKILKFEKSQQEKLKKDYPRFWVGDTLRVYTRIKEQDKERVLPFEGVVLKIQGQGLRKTFTLRKISHGEGVERTFPYYSPNIQKIEVLRKGKVRRKKLYYLREKIGKKAKIKQADRNS